ncbi:MAG: NFACT family protein [Phascolarctobacterium sp.]|uniref:Rqc2 family fibronectin-binding protein n=1 Tax=Phascolarctobacterium sp. TaxID=2049039 RepID=UPI0026DB01AD|nr:NFACT family protein [Phascolarctobacterium sp.]MDO4922051.1 NFACT family protein [Phascolarctobacterium sp.]
MNLEGLTLKLLADHLNGELLGSKIYKIFMPNPHALLLLVRRSRDVSALMGDISGGSPALYIPDKLPENPETPPSFCMLLRKHLEEGRITKISQSGLDRIITLEIDLLGQSSRIITKKLIFELTGKNANILLVQDDIIIDSLKHIGAAQSSYRTVLPGKPYVAPPPQSGLNILTDDPAAIVSAANSLPSANFAKAFVSATTGVGKATSGELLAVADILPQTVRLEMSEAKALTAAIKALQERVNSGSAPVYTIVSRTNQVKTILTLPPQNLEPGASVKEFANINSAINYAVSLRPMQLPQHEQLQKLVIAETGKLNKKLQALQQDLAHADDAEQQRILADTLMANIYQIKKGQTSAQLLNIYDGQPVQIALSPVLSPTENAQAYYKRYNKYKRAQSEVRLQIAAAEELLQYLASLDSSLLTATTKNEVEEIRQEMIAAGLLKLPGKKKYKNTLQKSQPLHLKISADTDLYIGKNNKQNDYVTFTLGGPKDLWFHTKDIPGSHVIMKTALPQPRQEDIALAVQLAAYFSKAREGSNVPVDCVQRRYVKKPAGSKPGFVIFTNQTTYYATPDSAALAKYTGE